MTALIETHNQLEDFLQNLFITKWIR